jgi:hypothetical protein
MDRIIKATLTRCSNLRPLVTIVDGVPGPDADLTPAALRALAAALIQIAQDAETRPTTGKHWTAARREYPIA